MLNKLVRTEVAVFGLVLAVAISPAVSASTQKILR